MSFFTTLNDSQIQRIFLIIVCLNLIEKGEKSKVDMQF